eukprot:1181702-Prorocentrum_minimum.AAC.1
MALVEHLHSTCGALSHHLWSTYTALVEHLHSTCGAPTHHLWSTCTAHTQRLWSTCGALTQHLWSTYAALVENLHSTCGEPTQHLWRTYTALVEHLPSTYTALVEHLHNTCGALTRHLHSTYTASAEHFKSKDGRHAAERSTYRACKGASNQSDSAPDMLITSNLSPAFAVAADVRALKERTRAFAAEALADLSDESDEYKVGPNHVAPGEIYHGIYHGIYLCWELLAHTLNSAPQKVTGPMPTNQSATFGRLRPIASRRAPGWTNRVAPTARLDQSH